MTLSNLRQSLKIVFMYILCANKVCALCTQHAHQTKKFDGKKWPFFSIFGNFLKIRIFIKNHVYRFYSAFNSKKNQKNGASPEKQKKISDLSFVMHYAAKHETRNYITKRTRNIYFKSTNTKRNWVSCIVGLYVLVITRNC